MLFAGNDGYKAHQVYLSDKCAPLAKIDGRVTDGDLITICQFQADFRSRVTGLYNKKVKKDLSMLIPLRVPGEEQSDKIKYLYLLPEEPDDAVNLLYEIYKVQRLDMQQVSELVVEICSIDDLPGDVPEAVRKNPQVSKDAIVLWRKNDDPAWGVFVIFGSGFLIYWLILYFKHSRKLKREEQQFN